MKVEWENNWGESTNESESRKRRNQNFELLRKSIREHHPILKEIKDRENEVEKLARHFPAKESDIPEEELLELEEARPLIGNYRPSTLERMLQEICEKQGEQTERAKILRAAIAWSEKRDEIDKLKQEAQAVLHPPYSKKDPRDYTEEYQARSSLERTIRDIMVYGDGHQIFTCNDDLDKDYAFRENFENFLDDITSERCYIREDFDSFRLYENIGKYLENPTWHSSIITDFLLVDLIDTSLIDLESSFQFGLFPARLAEQLGGPGSHFVPFINSMSPGLSPKAKKMRRKWRFKNLMIGSSLIYIWIGNWGGEKIVNLLANRSLDLPSVVFTITGYIGIGFLVHPILSLLYEFRNKIRTGYNKLAKVVREFVVIRFEIASGTYHAETLIERLKNLEKHGIMIHSLTYALLEL